MNSNILESVSTMKTTATFSRDKKHRYCLKMEWDNKKKSCAILMTYPSTADELILDQTTMLTRNGAVRNNFGSISIVNVFSLIGTQTPKSDRQNASVILKECSEADMILVAFGRNTAHTEQKNDTLKLIRDYADKIYTILDKNGAPYSHPLSPKAREWNIVKLDVEQVLAGLE